MRAGIKSHFLHTMDFRDSSVLYTPTNQNSIHRNSVHNHLHHLPTIKKLIADGGKVILCSHLGKPKGEPKPELSLAPVAVRLSELLGQEVKFAADPEVVGPNAKAAVEAMKDGDVILLENTRYRAEETKNGEEFSKELASLCDVFVNDAFGTAHRAHCSNVGVTKYVDTAVV